MKNFKRFTILAALTILGLGAKAQDTRTDNHAITIVIPDVALLDLETSVSKNFAATFVQSTEAGSKVTTPTTNSDLWLNYSSIIPTTIKSRRVDVKASALIGGVDIAVVAGAAKTGFGTKGAPNAGVTLTATDQPLIDKIGSAYTATGASNGHQLTYTFTALDDNYANLRAGKTDVTVTYTLADN